MLEKNSIQRIHKNFHVPCTTGSGAGMAGSIMTMISDNFIISLDSYSCLPTNQELEMLQSYLEYVIRKNYRNPERILNKLFPSIEGHNTVIFLKGDWWEANGKEGWCYRRMTWREGPLYIPTFNVSNPAPPPWSLVQALNHIETLQMEQWEQWKTGHAKIFTRQS